MLRSILIGCSAALAGVVSCSISLASDAKMDSGTQIVDTSENPGFANGSIVIHVVEWSAFESEPIRQADTRGQPQAVLTISGRLLYDKVSGWMTRQPPRRIKNWGGEDRVGAEFVIDFLRKDGEIQKTYISNGCIFEDDSGNLYPVGPDLRHFLEGLTAAGAVPGGCEGVDFESERGPDGSANTPMP